jgi:hypothetical protein
MWRKLRDLGALYLQDGVAALPEDAVTREQMEWLQLRVREAGARLPPSSARTGHPFLLRHGATSRSSVPTAENS